MWCGGGSWAYCFNIIDAYTRKWVSYSLASRVTAREAFKLLTEAVAMRVPGPGLVIRVDNGMQYTSRDFKETAKLLGMRLDYIHVNTLQQNGHIESFHKTLKKEYLWPADIGSLEEAKRLLDWAYEDYNQRRIHSSLGYITPHEFARGMEVRPQ